MRLELLHNWTDKNFYTRVLVPENEEIVLLYAVSKKGSLFEHCYFTCFEKRFLSIQDYPDVYLIIKLKKL